MAGGKPALKKSDFVHLHNHTQYSLLDGLTKVPALMDFVKSAGMEAIALTDHGTLSGTVEFYKSALSSHLKPIIGIETYMAARSLSDRQVDKDKTSYHLILLAMNQTGYLNLMALSTIANLEGFYYRPRIDHDLLAKYNEGLICLSGCANSEVGDALRAGDYDKAKKLAKWYQELFKDRYYLEVQDHGHPSHPGHWQDQKAINDGIIKLSKELAIKVVVTADAHYLRPEDKEAHEILLCVQTGSFLSDKDRMSLADFNLYVNRPEEIIDRWGKDHPDYILNTKEVASRCNLRIKLGNILIPKFPVPKGETEQSFLTKLTYQGLAFRYGKDSNGKRLSDSDAKNLSVPQAKKYLSKDVLERASLELEVINSMNFNGYFLIIADFVNWGKNQGIVFGPGRGSAAGSIVSYGLKITDLNPFDYDLLFERFLNPDRISMPDVDIDIQDNRRAEVINYCIDKYGTDRVANIVTFGRMAARNAVRDVSRVLEVPYAEADRLAKMIPPPQQGRHIPLAESLKDNYDLKREYESNASSKRVFDLAVQLEGTIRSHGVHAAGVVIAPEEIVHYTPLEMAQKGVVATQYSMGPIEELGLLKMDFLGLSNLTIINNALRIIRKLDKVSVDISNLPMDDQPTYELFQKGDTVGVFQFESAGMKRYLKELKPSVFGDLIAMNALYRPGPMQWIDEFIGRKTGKKPIVYLHPQAENALRGTYGVLVYQEQIMQIAKDLCGFTGSQADTLRKGVAKKKPEVLAALKKDFIDGALANSDIARPKIEQFWKSLEAFADYAFPKSHAACYSITAYQTAYLKAHFPNAFMAALMTSDYDDKDRLAIEIAECQRMGITVLQPDINESFVEFGVVPGKNEIRFGLVAIKNVGGGVVEDIITARQETPYSSISDFLSRAGPKAINRKSLESLVKAGVFDRWETRATLLDNLELMLAYASRQAKASLSGQTDLFSSSSKDSFQLPKLSLMPAKKEINSRQQLAWERELLGLYLSHHPLESYKAVLEAKTSSIKQLTTSDDGKNLTIGGTVSEVRAITTKSGLKMAFVKVEDYSGEIEVIVFPKLYNQDPGLWERDKILLVKGRLSVRDKDGNVTDEIKISADEASELTETEAASFDGQPTDSQFPSERLYINLLTKNDEKTLLSLKKTIDRHRGKTQVILVLGETQSKQAIRLPGGIDKDDSALNELSQLVGAENVVLKQ